ncbi:quinoprotein dehydrogenase-associated SoxYZ-like carrier [Macromonas nakdongensis]|uniref:quinoprotein dehydrogenase-associated SoxYZ-like carrier n=1 Tax=Macromonas nakdongensis TaxID=1843082 RepID=UPI000C328E47|nr:quinoprotein dehydrogenase-associated SoxYZ-like carrier [Macromonas nakdongensis]
MPPSPSQPPRGPNRRRWLRDNAWRLGTLGAGSLGWALPAQAQDDPTGGDPLGSMQWPVVRRKFMGTEAAEFSPQVLIKGPPFAEDAMNVPVLLDARALVQAGHTIDRIVVVADRNPVQHVLTFEPRQALPVLAFRFRLEQGSPLRALVRTQDGRWHVGQTWVNAAGGGCTVPGATRADGSWSQTLNQVQARFFRNVLEGSGTRLRVRVMHPMDTGLVAGIPAFHIEELELRDSADRLWWRLELHEPVSENPLITFELGRTPPGTMVLQGRDNNGNRIHHEVAA